MAIKLKKNDRPYCYNSKSKEEAKQDVKEKVQKFKDNVIAGLQKRRENGNYLTSSTVYSVLIGW